MRTAAAALVRRRRMDRLRREVSAPKKGRLMYPCPQCRKWTYSLVSHRCGKRMSYPGGFG